MPVEWISKSVEVKRIFKVKWRGIEEYLGFLFFHLGLSFIILCSFVASGKLPFCEFFSIFCPDLGLSTPSFRSSCPSPPMCLSRLTLQCELYSYLCFSVFIAILASTWWCSEWPGRNLPFDSSVTWARKKSGIIMLMECSSLKFKSQNKNQFVNTGKQILNTPHYMSRLEIECSRRSVPQGITESFGMNENFVALNNS